MSGWKEQMKQNTLTKTSSSVTATRIFLWTPDGTDTLPNVGDSWTGYADDDLITPLYVQQLVRTFAGDHPDIRQWEVQYSAVTRSALDTPFDDLMRNVDIGGELFNIGHNGSQYWTSGGTVEQDMFKRVVTMSIRIPKVYPSFEFFATKMMQNAGCVNELTFHGFEPKQLLFMGANVTEIRTPKGVKAWKAELVFEYRAPILSGGGNGTWEHVWNETTQDWDTLANPIYTAKDFKTTLFGIVES